MSNLTSASIAALTALSVVTTAGDSVLAEDGQLIVESVPTVSETVQKKSESSNEISLDAYLSLSAEDLRSELSGAMLRKMREMALSNPAEFGSKVIEIFKKDSTSDAVSQIGLLWRKNPQEFGVLAMAAFKEITARNGRGVHGAMFEISAMGWAYPQEFGVYAIEIFKEINTKKAVLSIQAMLRWNSSLEFVTAAITTLKEIGTGDAIQSITEIAFDSSPDARALCVTTLKEIGTDDAIEGVALIGKILPQEFGMEAIKAWKVLRTTKAIREIAEFGRNHPREFGEAVMDALQDLRREGVNTQSAARTLTNAWFEAAVAQDVLERTSPKDRKQRAALLGKLDESGLLKNITRGSLKEVYQQASAMVPPSDTKKTIRKMVREVLLPPEPTY